jgi:hypothetical protein
VVGRIACRCCCCRASACRSGIEALLVGWRRGCTLAAAVVCRRMFGTVWVEGDGVVIGGWASWSAVWETG